jgi:hypothetical protein
MGIKAALAAVGVVLAGLSPAQAGTTLAFSTTLQGTLNECSAFFGTVAGSYCLGTPIGTSVPIFLSGTFEVPDPTQDALVTDGFSFNPTLGTPSTLIATSNIFWLPSILAGGNFRGQYTAPTQTGGVGQFELHSFSGGLSQPIPFGGTFLHSLDSSSSGGDGEFGVRSLGGVSSTGNDYHVRILFPAISSAAPVTTSFSFVAPPPEPIPLPAGLWLALTGLGALGLLRRRAGQA